MEKFKIGKRTGSKVDPCSAYKEMMYPGQFERRQFLSAQQIASYSLRLSQKVRKSAKVESAHDQLKKGNCCLLTVIYRFRRYNKHILKCLRKASLTSFISFKT